MSTLVFQTRLCVIRPSNLWSFSTATSNFCSDSTQNIEKQDDCEHTSDNERKPVTITDKFTHSMRMVEAERTKNRLKNTKDKIGTSKLLKPADNYTSRFQYNGYLKSRHWQFYDNERLGAFGPETEEQYNYRMLKKHKFCVLLGFAGGNYFGMQYNKNVHTVEEVLLEAMVRNRWILSEHKQKSWLIDFQRGSRTDRGVSAARQNISLTLREYARLASIFFKSNRVQLIFFV